MELLFFHGLDLLWKKRKEEKRKAHGVGFFVFSPWMWRTSQARSVSCMSILENFYSVGPSSLVGETRSGAHRHECNLRGGHHSIAGELRLFSCGSALAMSYVFFSRSRSSLTMCFFFLFKKMFQHHQVGLEFGALSLELAVKS